MLIASLQSTCLSVPLAQLKVIHNHGRWTGGPPGSVILMAISVSDIYTRVPFSLLHVWEVLCSKVVHSALISQRRKKKYGHKFWRRLMASSLGLFCRDVCGWRGALVH